MNCLLKSILSIINLALCFIMFFKYLHILQLKNYKTNIYFKWTFTHKLTLIYIIIFSLCSAVFIAVNLLDFYFFKTDYLIFICFAGFVLSAVLALKSMPLLNKTPLKVTNRIKRILTVSIIFCLLLHAGLIFIENAILNYFYMPLLFGLCPYFLALCNFIELPLEKLLQQKFFKQSKQKLKSFRNLKVVGITGSVGKTSTKEILFHLLRDNFNVVKSPLSFNTPLGLSRTINDYLNENTQIFIAEMGAKQAKDIKVLCNYVKPVMGIVTSVASQHMQTFKNIENVYKTKKELPDYLQENFCAFNADNEYVLKMYNQKQGNKLAISTKNEADLYAKNIEIKDNLTHFDLVFDNISYPLSTKLLGSHNITNILLAIAVALQFGMTIDDIAKRIETIPQVEHRLQLVKGANGVNVLDDSYNCSVDSASEALSVLSKFNHKRIVCTPGIVEGGKMQFEINYNLAYKISKTADAIIIVGKTNKAAFKKRFKELKLDENIYYVDNLSQAKLLFAHILEQGDTLLLLNDLPDDYL